MRTPLALAALATLSLAPALAHEGHCTAIPADGVYEVMALMGASNASYEPKTLAFLIRETGENVLPEDVIWGSTDGRWWRCKRGGTVLLIAPTESR